MKTFTMLLVVALISILSSPVYADDAATEKLWKTKCQSCHAADGSGNTPAGKKVEARDLRLAEIQKQNDAELFEITKKGKNKMPGYDKKLSDQQIKDLVAYIRELGKKK
ncbi:MAG: cytochrome c [Acidobacteriales bacterium]|nr:cytochrome c [Terriglobales bacterium]